MYTDLGYGGNDLATFIGAQEFNVRAFGSVWMACTTDNLRGYEKGEKCSDIPLDECSAIKTCCIDISDVSFRIAENFIPVIPPPPEVPPYPNQATYKINEVATYTRDFDDLK